ncbi:MAG: hypothetical protein QOJ32_2862 [Frankiaceae bacterium]|nr:hypothetical protein [Frankiaceae bacterium]
MLTELTVSIVSDVKTRRLRLDRRPLLDTGPDAELFVGREAELTRLQRAVELGLNAVVVGEPGTGTSSLLRHLAWSMRSRKLAAPIQVGAAAAEDVPTLLRGVLRRVAGDEAAAVAQIGALDAAALLDRLGRALPRGAIVLLDDLPAGLGRLLFGSLRDEVWRLGAQWVVAATSAAADDLLRPPVDAFFENVLRLGPLSAVEARKMLRRRGVELTKADAAVLTELSGGVPRRLVDLARALVEDGRTPAELAAESDAASQRLAEVSDSARALVAVLRDLGASSPSDPALQQRMQVTRPRLVALFTELRDAGLVVEATPDRTGSARTGRPRQRWVLTGTVGAPVHADPNAF